MVQQWKGGPSGFGSVGLATLKYVSRDMTKIESSDSCFRVTNNFNLFTPDWLIDWLAKRVRACANWRIFVWGTRPSNFHEWYKIHEIRASFLPRKFPAIRYLSYVPCELLEAKNSDRVKCSLATQNMLFDNNSHQGLISCPKLFGVFCCWVRLLCSVIV